MIWHAECEMEESKCHYVVRRSHTHLLDDLWGAGYGLELDIRIMRGRDKYILDSNVSRWLLCLDSNSSSGLEPILILYSPSISSETRENLRHHGQDGDPKRLQGQL